MRHAGSRLRLRCNPQRSLCRSCAGRHTVGEPGHGFSETGVLSFFLLTSVVRKMQMTSANMTNRIIRCFTIIGRSCVTVLDHRAAARALTCKWYSKAGFHAHHTSNTHFLPRRSLVLCPLSWFIRVRRLDYITPTSSTEMSLASIHTFSLRICERLRISSSKLKYLNFCYFRVLRGACALAHSGTMRVGRRLSFIDERQSHTMSYRRESETPKLQR